MLTRKPLRRRRRTPLLLGALLAVSVLGTATGLRAGDCDGCCNNRHCPGPYVHCMERPPCIKFKCTCPKPVCPPCDADFWGYYPTCWRRWPAMFPNCPERNPPWVAVAPPGVPAGFSNSLLPRGESAPAMPGTGSPTMPRPGYGEGTVPGGGEVMTAPAYPQMQPAYPQMQPAYPQMQPAPTAVSSMNRAQWGPAHSQSPSPAMPAPLQERIVR
jgi:hypothetical protein